MEEERRSGRIRGKILEVLESLLGDNIQFSEETISAKELHDNINPDKNAPDFTPFNQMFRELDALRTSEQIEEPIRAIAEQIYWKSHHLDREEYFNRRKVH